MGGRGMENRTAPLYQLILSNREKVKLNGVTEVESFDEKKVLAVSKMGPLMVKGEGLHITQLNLDEGLLAIEGIFNSLEFIEDKQAKLKATGKGILSRLFK